MLTREEAKAAMLRKLKDSALNAEDAATLKFRALTAQELKIKHPELPPAAGFTLPYFQFDGKTNGFFRYRYLEQPAWKGFKALTEKKELRYSQPAGEKPRVYFPPYVEWPEFFAAEDAAKQLVITEGELKAACASKLGIPTVALGGVWNFKAGDNLIIPELAALPWKGLKVFIAYDSDAQTNVQIVQAENRLAAELLERGAHVFMLRIPALKDLKKTGLDDYLVREGSEAFRRLTGETDEWTRSAALYALNESVLFVHSSGTVIERATGVRMTAQLFAHSTYANVIMEEKVEKKGGDFKVVKKPAALEWLKWPGRAEVTRTTYLPGCPLITDANELNTWPGWGLPPELVKPGSIRLWRRLIEFIFHGAEPEHVRWFEQWLAYPLQHPGTKLNSAVVVWGLVEGTGKTLIGASMSRIYGRNFREIADRDLLSNFNEWADGRQFVMGDEITGGDKRASADRMKSIITQQYVTINPKFISPYTIPDCINYYFTSNHPDSFFLGDNDRRYFIHEVKSSPLPDSFYADYDRWYRSDAIGALFYYLLRLDLTGFNPRAKAPITSSKNEMLEMGRSEAAAWVAELKNGPILHGGRELKRALFTTEELYRLFDAGGNSRLKVSGMARELKRAGFERALGGEKITAAGKLRSLWVIKDREALSKLKDAAALAARYERDLGWRENAKRKY